MPLQVGELFAKLSLDNADFRRSLSVSKQDLSSVGSEAQRTGGLISRVFSNAGDVVKQAFGFALAGQLTQIPGKLKDIALAGSDLNESVNKAQVVFGDATQAVLNWAKNSSSAMGQSKQSAIEMAATFGNLLTSMGLTGTQAASLSTNIVQLAGDLASFNNVSPEDALAALKSGLVGEVEPLRQFGVALSETAVANEAVRLGLAKSTNAVSDQAKVIARYSLIMQQTKNAQGDFQRTSSGMANSIRIIQAAFQDTATVIGEKLFPYLQPVVAAFGQRMPAAVDRAGEAFGTFIDYAVAVFNALQGFDLRSVLLGWLQQSINFEQTLKVAGHNLAVSYAQGILDGGIGAVQDAVTYISNLISSYLIGHSPPPVGPLRDIVRGGTAVMVAYTQGMLQGVAGVQDVAATVDQALSGLGDALDLSTSIAGLDQANAKAAELDDLVTQIGDNTGKIDLALEALSLAQDEINQKMAKLDDQISDVQGQIDKVNDSYDDAIAPLQRQLDLLQKQRDYAEEKVRLQQQLSSLQNEQAMLEAQGDPVKRAQLEGQLAALNVQQEIVDNQQQQADITKRLADPEEHLTANQKASLELQKSQLALRLQELQMIDQQGLAQATTQGDILDAQSKGLDIIEQTRDANKQLAEIPLQQQIDKLNDSREKALAPLNAQIEALNKQKEPLQQQLKFLQDQADDLNLTKERWQLVADTITQAEAPLKRNIDATQQLKDELDQAAKKAESLTDGLKGSKGGGGAAGLDLPPALDPATIDAQLAELVPQQLETPTPESATPMVNAEHGPLSKDAQTQGATFGKDFAKAMLSQIGEFVKERIGTILGSILGSITGRTIGAAVGTAIGLALPGAQFFTPLLAGLGSLIGGTLGAFIGNDLQKQLQGFDWESLLSFGMGGDGGGMFAGVQASGDDLVKWLGSTFGPALEQWGKLGSMVWDSLSGTIDRTIKQVRPQLQDLGTSLQGLVPLFEFLGQVVGALVLGFTGLVLLLGSGLLGLIGGALPGLVVTLTGLFQAIGGVFGLISDTLTGVVDIVTDIIHGDWSKAWSDAGQMVLNLYLDIAQILGGLLLAVAGIVYGIYNAVIGAFQAMYDFLVGHSLIPDLVDAITGLFQTLWDNTGGLVLGLITDVAGYFQQLYDDAVAKVGNVYTSVTGTFTSLKTDAAQLVSDLWTAVSGFFSNLYNDATTFISNLYTDVTTEFGNLKTDASKTVSDFWTDVSNFFSNIYTDVTTYISNAVAEVERLWDQLKTDIDQKVSAMEETLGAPFDWLETAVKDPKGFVHSAFDEVKNAWDGLKAKLDDAKTDMQDTLMAPFKWLGENIGSTVTGGLNDAIDALNNGLERIGEFVNGVGGAINWVANAVGLDNLVPHWDAPSIPKLATGGRIGSAGLAQVHKDELLFLPEGAEVIPRTESKNILQGLDGPAPFDDQPTKLGMGGSVSGFIGNLMKSAGDVAQATIGELNDAIAKGAQWTVEQSLQKLNIDALGGYLGDLQKGVVNKLKDVAIEAVQGIFDGLKSQGWAKPIQNYVVTQEFGPSGLSLEPAYGGYAHFHQGIDLAGPQGEPITAAKYGTVRAVGDAGDGYGTKVVLEHLNGIETLYGHLRDAVVALGQTVQGKQLIGHEDSTGASTGPHLHFGVMEGGAWVNPRSILQFGNGGYVTGPTLGLLGENAANRPEVVAGEPQIRRILREEMGLGGTATPRTWYGNATIIQQPGATLEDLFQELGN